MIAELDLALALLTCIPRCNNSFLLHEKNKQKNSETEESGNRPGGDVLGSGQSSTAAVQGHGRQPAGSRHLVDEQRSVEERRDYSEWKLSQHVIS